MPFGSVVVVIVGGLAAIVMLRLLAALATGTVSLALMAKLAVCAVVGVPVMHPAVRDVPAGTEPLSMA
jgi:hypothetical protein